MLSGEITSRPSKAIIQPHHRLILMKVGLGNAPKGQKAASPGTSGFVACVPVLQERKNALGNSKRGG